MQANLKAAQANIKPFKRACNASQEKKKLKNARPLSEDKWE
jgi:hypothetical protein